MSKVEAVAVVPADAGAVWEAVLDGSRWRGWRAADVGLDHIEHLDGTFERIGDRRRCVATISRLPIVRRRRLAWDERVTDVDVAQTIEVEADGRRGALRRWRLRLWLVPQVDGQTRVRCSLTYRPANVVVWLVDRLLLRRRLSVALEAWVRDLASLFVPVAAEESTPPVAEKAEAATPVVHIAAASGIEPSVEPARIEPREDERTDAPRRPVAA